MTGTPTNAAAAAPGLRQRALAPPRLPLPSLPPLLLILLPAAASVVQLAGGVAAGRQEQDQDQDQDRDQDQGQGQGQGQDQLGELADRLGREGDEDASSHGRASCWCKKNLAAKDADVESLRNDITMLSHDIAGQTAENDRLRVEVESHERDLKAGQQSLDTVNDLRSKDAGKASEDIRHHEQSITAIDAALRALDGPSGGGGGGAVLTALRSVEASNGQGRGVGEAMTLSRQLLLQLQGRLRGTSSPEVIRGVLKEMRDKFSRNLEEIKRGEVDTKSRHDGLAEAKAAEMEALKSQYTDKKRRLAEGKVQVTRNQEVMTSSEKLLEDSLALLRAMSSMCDHGEGAFQSRQSERQAELVALSSARADLAGAQLVSVVAGGRRLKRGADLDAMCSLAQEVSEQNEEEARWRRTASRLCEQAKAAQAAGGAQAQEAADAAEAWKGELEAARAAAARERERCQQVTHRASVVSEETAAHAELVDGDRKAANYLIDALEAQASAAEESRAALGDIGRERQRSMHAIQLLAAQAAELLKRAAAAASHPAGAKLQKAARHAERLGQVAATFDAAASGDEQKVAGLVDAIQGDVRKVLVPLRLAHADAEEKEVALHELQRGGGQRLAAIGVRCDAAALDARLKRLGGYVERLGAASEALAYDALA